MNLSKSKENKTMHPITKFLLASISVLITVTTVLVIFVVPYRPVTDGPVKDSPVTTLWEALVNPTKNAQPIPGVPTGEQLAHPSEPYIGVYATDPIKGTLEFDAKTGIKTNAVLIFKNWEDHVEFNGTEYKKANNIGKLPIISWEPWNPDGDKKTQPEYTLQSIVDGKHDAYIRDWAQNIKALKFGVGMRFAHEMNGDWYPWSITENTNTPEAYVKAWQHVHDIFAEEGASNVMWIWSVNLNRTLLDVPLKPAYPGDAYVDVVGFSGYGSRPDELFQDTVQSTVDELRKITAKPIMVTETGASEDTKVKALWISSMFAYFKDNPDFVGVLWFNGTGRKDWRVNTTKESTFAYQAGAADFVESYKKAQEKQ